MARKTEMPEDVRRITAEMRKAHDNQDPRPQLKRRNPKAVSAAEVKTQLRAFRENTPSISAGNIRNYLTSMAQKLTPFIDHGIADMYTAPMFDINQMALDAKDMAPRDALRLFYGDRTDEIVDRAMALRARFNNYGTSEDELRGLSPMNYALSIRNKPSKGETSKRQTQRANHNTLKEIDDRYPKARSFISWLIDRPYASPYRGGAHTAHDKSAAAHERFGHNLNPATKFAGNTNERDDFANDNELLLTNLYAIIGDGQAFYTHRNQDEFAAAFGNLRKSIYKRSEGKLDIADPVVFERVVEDYAKHPGTYSGSWLTDDSRELLNTGSSYPGLLVPADKGTIERGYEIEESLGDPDYTHQFVKTSSTNNTKAAAAKGGDAAGESKSSGVPKGHNPALDGYSGPRVVINPTTFKNEKDGLCVSFNEAFRILMAVNGFDPVAEPTEKQREFFSDTAYAHDELQMRRTILARICTFDTSVTDPTDEQLQEAVEFLDTVLEIGAPQNQWEQRAVERIRTAISQALESGERVPASQAPAPEDSPKIAAGGAGSSAGGVPEDEEKDSGAEFRENAQAQMDEATKLAQEGPTAEEQKTRAMAEAAGKAAGDDPFGKSAEMNAAAQEAGLKADIAGAQKPENLMQKNGHYVDAQGRVISERAARALAEQNVRNAAAQDMNNQQQQALAADTGVAQNSPQTASERIGTTSGIKGLGGRELTAGEAAWQARKQASTAAWMQRTGRSGDGVADALAQRDERANNLRQNSQVDSGRRDLLGRRLDDRGRVIV